LNDIIGKVIKMSERIGNYIKIDRKEFGPCVPAIGQFFTMKLLESNDIIKVRITGIHEEHFDAEFC